MAQLRDIQTSEVIFEDDTVEAVVAVAREIGYDEVLFDDVVPGFDAEATWVAYEEQRVALESASKSRAAAATQETRAAAKEQLEQLEQVADVSDEVATVRTRLEQARERSEAAARYE